VTSRVAGLPNDVGVWPEVKTDAEIWPREKGRIPAGSWVPKGALNDGAEPRPGSAPRPSARCPPHDSMLDPASTVVLRKWSFFSDWRVPPSPRALLLLFALVALCCLVPSGLAFVGSPCLSQASYRPYPTTVTAPAAAIPVPSP
jgi:hypothetical protein